MDHPNSFGARATLDVAGKSYRIYKLDALKERGLDPGRLPYGLKVLLENLLRTEGSGSVTADDIRALASWDPNAQPNREIAFTPARVILQDFTGVPAVVDLAAMRDAMKALGGDPERINPLAPVELVIDHSVIVEDFGHNASFKRNQEIEYRRDLERYKFLRWGQTAFDNFRVVPPTPERAPGEPGAPGPRCVHA
ncbi:Aconitate hydratase OS=Castellaniella defragrans OX=75697 GN=HNR28_000078 PE=3 SV=1 [Castellaniella defragrans]